MSLLRLIARLDIKGPNVVKGICFEGLRVVGNPSALARKYAEGGADELLYIDTVATLYGRNQLAGLLEETTSDVFIPVTVCGGVKSRADVRRLLEAGADKVAINTAAIRNPMLVKECSDYYGAQCIVVSIEAKRVEMGWEAFTDNGREKTGKDAVEWAHEAVELGAGEILLTAIDKDGTMRGPDQELIRRCRDISVPLTYCGGIACEDHMEMAIGAGADAVVMASALHYGKMDLKEMSNERRTRILEPHRL